MSRLTARNRVALLVSLVCLGALVLFATPSNAVIGGITFRAELTAPDGTTAPSGEATLTLTPVGGEPDEWQLCYTLTTENVADGINIVAAHLHTLAFPPPDDIAVTLGADENATVSGCEVISRALAIDIITNPEIYYVNVHSDQNLAVVLTGPIVLSTPVR
jgi:hypothetical protein